METRNYPPHNIIAIDENDLDSFGDTITTVLIKREDGKIGRVNLRIAGHNGKVKASVTTDNPDHDTTKTVTVKFGWEQHPEDEHAVEYPAGDPRRTN